MSWAQRLQRVFNVAIETCRDGGGAVRIIAGSEDPVVMQKLLTPLKEQTAPAPLRLLPAARAPPAGVFG